MSQSCPSVSEFPIAGKFPVTSRYSIKRNGVGYYFFQTWIVKPVLSVRRGVVRVKLFFTKGRTCGLLIPQPGLEVRKEILTAGLQRGGKKDERLVLSLQLCVLLEFPFYLDESLSGIVGKVRYTQAFLYNGICLSEGLIRADS